MKKQKMILMFAIFAMLAILIAACQPTTNTKPSTKIPGTPVVKGTYFEGAVFDPNAELNAKNFASEAELSNFMKENAARGGYYGGGRALAMDMAVESVAMTKTSAAAEAPSAARDYSKTNVQVQNVDEADIIKTDGEYIYTVSGNTVFIIKAYPGEDAKVVSTIKFKDSPSSLFIDNDHLAVFGNLYNLDFLKEVNFQARQGMTFFNIYDISDKENPKLVKEYKFEGNYFQARMTDDYVYFVTTTGTYYGGPRPMPVMIDGTTVKPMAIKDIYYYPIHYQSVQFANIHVIDLSDIEKEVRSKSIAVEDSQNMYMSEGNIYITYTEYINEGELRNKIIIDLMMDKVTPADRGVIDKIKQTDNDVLSQQEKEAKILQIVQNYIQFMPESEQNALNDQIDELLQKKLDEYEYMEYTIINKVSVKNGNIDIDANGKVPGHIINQFSMDEDTDGTFRIATTLSQRWSYVKKENTQTESSNNVFALDEDLRILSSLKGLAEGEQIYSTRFIGERLYMVTFRQVDPFFVIDLSNPRNIKELGKLKIPGFSRYLHPYDEDTIIGIGRDASETSGQTRGLKISLFDVSDVENPKEIAKFVTEERYAQSTAEYEHKAFMFSKEKDLLVIPAYSQTWRPWREGMPSQSEEDYNGAMVFKITKDEITMRGIIDHSMGKGNTYGPLVERSLYIDGLLYTKSPSLLRINKIEDLSKVKNIDLESSNSPYPVY